MFAVEDQVLVHLVGDDQQIPLDGERGHGRQFVAREDRAGRVVRGVEEDQPGARGDRVAQFVQVQVVRAVAGTQGDGDSGAAREGDGGGVRVVVRLQRDDLVAGLDQGQQRGGDRLGGARRDQDLGVGEALAQVDRAGANGQGRHLGEDRRPELREASVEHGTVVWRGLRGSWRSSCAEALDLLNSRPVLGACDGTRHTASDQGVSRRRLSSPVDVGHPPTATDGPVVGPDRMGEAHGEVALRASLKGS